MEITVSELLIGMTVCAEVVSRNGVVLVGPGTKVTESLLERIHNFRSSAGVLEPIWVVRTG